MSPVRSASHVSDRYRGGAARKSACATAVSEGCIGSRIRTVDAVRGAVMILMALDHGDFIHSAAMSFSPTDLAHTTAAIFLTRWVTHFCAPVFAFTAGMGAFLWVRRNRTTAQLSRFLLTRGLWLIVLELTVLRFILYLNIAFHNTRIVLLVIWMLGASIRFDGCVGGVGTFTHSLAGSREYRDHYISQSPRSCCGCAVRPGKVGLGHSPPASDLPRRWR